MKIKKYFLFILLIILCGCTSVKDKNYQDIISNLSTHNSNYNISHTGFKYYLPNNLEVDKYNLYNDVIVSDKYTYYLYVDVISYNKQTKVDYEVNNLAYISNTLEYDNKYGYLEVNLKENNQYLIEIMFNYAKIEVMVDYDDINLALSYAVSILRSIEYNDSVIENLVSADILNYQEETYNIFNTTSSDSNYLNTIEVDDEDDTEESDIKDIDLVD